MRIVHIFLGLFGLLGAAAAAGTGYAMGMPLWSVIGIFFLVGMLIPAVYVAVLALLAMTSGANGRAKRADSVDETPDPGTANIDR
ncbi:hypothetical protein [Frigidibacter sp. MR17.14]|uniref:hypothetical protein n=1 Tax=Frigidibacter sp. MR17.14 TaxID=3126509 RepID=UPI0030130ACE